MNAQRQEGMMETTTGAGGMKMWWLDHWAGVCFWIARRFRAVAHFWEQAGNRAYGEWERRQIGAGQMTVCERKKHELDCATNAKEPGPCDCTTEEGDRG